MSSCQAHQLLLTYEYLAQQNFYRHFAQWHLSKNDQEIKVQRNEKHRIYRQQ